MLLFRRAQIFLLSAIAAEIKGAATNPDNCTEAKKIYYGTYKFAMCERDLSRYWCYSKRQDFGNSQAKFFKETDPENFKENSNCSDYYTTCGYLRFLSQVCGSHYKVCHTEQERKSIIKLWIKQFLRKEDRYTRGGFKRYKENFELKNGKCNDILQEFFDKDEMEEISDEFDQSKGHNFKTNITYSQMGVLVNANGSRISIAESSKYLNLSESDLSSLTLPSHWKYCEWKLVHKLVLVFSNKAWTETLPYFWHCDGKCNSNEGDNQAWSDKLRSRNEFGSLEVRDSYIDLNDGEVKTEDYMADLATSHVDYYKNITDEGIYGCYIRTSEDDIKDDCQRYQKFIKYCLEPINRCLGNVAIREVIISTLIKRDFKPAACWQTSVSNGNNSKALMISLAVATSAVLLGTILLCYCCKKRREGTHADQGGANHKEIPIEI